MNQLGLRARSHEESGARDCVRAFFTAMSKQRPDSARKLARGDLAWFGKSADWSRMSELLLDSEVGDIRSMSTSALDAMPPATARRVCGVVDVTDSVVLCDLRVGEHEVTVLAVVGKDATLRSVRDPEDFVQFVDAVALLHEAV